VSGFRFSDGSIDFGVAPPPVIPTNCVGVTLVVGVTTGAGVSFAVDSDLITTGSVGV